MICKMLVFFTTHNMSTVLVYPFAAKLASADSACGVNQRGDIKFVR